MYRFGDFYRSLKWAWQRVVRGYDDRAYWGLDSYLTEITLPVLKYLRENKSGIPYTKESQYSDGKDDHDEEVWDKELTDMIDAFQLMHNDDFEDVPNEGWQEREIRIKKGLASFAKYYKALWD